MPFVTIGSSLEKQKNRRSIEEVLKLTITKNVKRFLAIAIVLITAFAMMSVVASAALYNEYYAWTQASTTDYYVSNFDTLYPGSNINLNGIRATGTIKTQSGSGSLKAKFQYRNFWGTWIDVGPEFSISQSTSGQSFLLTYSTTSSKTYRVKFYNPSNPTTVYINNFSLYEY